MRPPTEAARFPRPKIIHSRYERLRVENGFDVSQGPRPSPAAISSSLWLIFSFRVWGHLGRGKGVQSHRGSAPLCFIIVGGVPSRPQDPLGTLGPRLRFPLSPGACFRLRASSCAAPNVGAIVGPDR